MQVWGWQKARDTFQVSTDNDKEIDQKRIDIHKKRSCGRLVGLKWDRNGYKSKSIHYVYYIMIK